MKSVYKIIDHDISDNVLIIEEKDRPSPELTEILVEVKACATSTFDSKLLHELFTKNPRLHVAAGLEVAGVVSEVGPNASKLQPGDRVAGLLSLDSTSSGLSAFCVLEELDVVKLPEALDYVTVVGCLGDGLKAYSALQYSARTLPGDVVLVFDGASPWSHLTIQLAKLWRCKVIATVSTIDERTRLEHLKTSPDLIFETGTKTSTFFNRILEETGGLGVNVIIDNGVRLFSSDEDCLLVGEDTNSGLPNKHEIISVLSAGGRWVTSHPQLQLDPPNSEQLYLRGASVCFLFPQLWTLCPTSQGKLQHILHDLIQKLASGEVTTQPPKTVSFKSVLDSIEEGNVSLSPGMVVTM